MEANTVSMKSPHALSTIHVLLLIMSSISLAIDCNTVLNSGLSQKTKKHLILEPQSVSPSLVYILCNFLDHHKIFDKVVHLGLGHVRHIQETG